MRVAVVGVWVMVSSCGSGSSPSWDSAKEMVREDFPNVEHISADELKDALDSQATPEPVLLDVRQEEEYVVSHLPGAVRVEPGSGASEVVESLDPDTPIVAYCSVGYRSSELVQKLQERGFTNVKNLEGSIFEWANRGYPVERAGERVREVHPFNEEWGRLLHEDLRAYVPGSSDSTDSK